MDLLVFTTRILATIFFGFIIGFERQLTGHPAGIRTNMLVSLGASIFVMFSIMVNAPDLTRVAAQIVTGIGFLGSGIIFKDGMNIRGLTTAATIWCTAAIGVLTSAGFIIHAFVATGLLILVNVLLRPVSLRVNPYGQLDENEKTYQIKVICDSDKEMQIRSTIIDHLSQAKMMITDLASNEITEGKIQIIAKMNGYGKNQDNIAEALVTKISSEQHVSAVSWELI